LKSLIDGNGGRIEANAQGIQENGRRIEANAQLIEDNGRRIEANARGIQENGRGISRNFEMIGRIYEEHGGRLDGIDGRLTRVEVGQEQLRDDLRAVAEGVTGNSERLDHLDRRFDRLEAKFDDLSIVITAGFTDHEQRLRALEN